MPHLSKVVQKRTALVGSEDGHFQELPVLFVITLVIIVMTIHAIAPHAKWFKWVMWGMVGVLIIAGIGGVVMIGTALWVIGAYILEERQLKKKRRAGGS